MNFLTILTRVHPARSKCLERNIESIKSQTDGDVQHILLHPTIEENDVIKVGSLIHGAMNLIDGRYVLLLDDDDILAKPEFVEKLKTVVGADEAEMVIFRGTLGHEICPKDGYWKSRKIIIGEISGSCVVVRKDLFDKTSHEWMRPVYESDFYYIKAAFDLSKNTVWWDYVGYETQGINRNNHGRSEEFIKLKQRGEA